jgi:L-glyceraldehyde 3-phosphate reductase
MGVNMSYIADTSRYDKMTYNRCGKSGLKLPNISLGLWHNFGFNDSYETARHMLFTAFDNGITHFDLANNYGPPPGSAEETFGKILQSNLKSYRDEMIISTKAGYDMWPGPYGDFGSRKYLVASLEQSLKRMNLDYVDIFYHHRPDPETPLYETMSALDYIVRSGKALYVGISNYNAEQTRQAVKILRKLGTPCLIHQTKYSMFVRNIEKELIQTLDDEGIGCICFSPLAQGMLTNKYLEGIPQDSRAASEDGYLKTADVTATKIEIIKKLNAIALERGQTLAQMAIAWTLRFPGMTSALIGASKVEQIEDILKIKSNMNFSDEELKQIDIILEST